MFARELNDLLLSNLNSSRAEIALSYRLICIAADERDYYMKFSNFTLSLPDRCGLSVSALAVVAVLGTLLVPGSLYAQQSAEVQSEPPGSANDATNLTAMECAIQPEWLIQGQRDLQALGLIPGQTYIFSDNFDMSENRFASYEGNVRLLQDDSILTTGAATYDKELGIFQATGGISYTDGYIGVRAEEVETNTQLQTIQINDAEYILIPASALGEARSIDITGREGERAIALNRSTFTTCPGDNPVWQISAGQIELHESDSWGVARNAQFRILGVPVLYIPRLSFPLTDERKSGFLYPTISSSSRLGLELQVPYYLNLAPNYDLTLTPRYMSRRGLMGMAEQRYLTDSHEGQVNVEFLNEDNRHPTNNSRHFVRVEHKAEFTDRWSGYLEFSQVSDTAYINDFDSDFANRADANLYRRGQLRYDGDLTRVQIMMEDFQELGPYTPAYQTLPRLSIWHDVAEMPVFDFDVFSELSVFRNPEIPGSDAIRLHAEPKLSYRQERAGWDWTADLSYLLTHYNQDTDYGLESGITRAMPQFRWHGRLHLERDTSWVSGGTQTLVPQIQYLYVPYRDQSQIGIYDTILIQDDYHSLFRPRRFTGLDRIADANQITVGATTRIFDAEAEELMRFSLGQIHYLENSETQLFDETSRITASNSELAAELDFRLSDRWFFSSAIQYDTTLSLTRKNRAAIEYRKDDRNLIQLNHRRVRGLVGTTQEVEQTGLVSAWRLSSAWSVAAHWYHDLQSNKAVDALFAVQYDECCWSVRLSAYRRIERNFEQLNMSTYNMLNSLPPAQFDNGIQLQFMLTGLSFGSGSLSDMLQQGIFGYRRPFYLSN